MSDVSALIITAINDRLSRVAVADKLYNATDVEPVFKPVQPG